jgi:Ca2+-binding RTX toxin-like protein
VTFSLGANVENLVLLGSANFNGTGNTLNNSITGNAGANTLSGGEGSDTLSGGDGADILDGGEGADTMFGGLGDDTFYVDNAGDVTGEGSALGGIDTVYSSVTRVLGAHIENLTLTGTADINGTGNDLNNIQIGNDGANTLSDGVGNDQLYGGGGVDLLIGGSGTDYLDGGSGGDTMYGGLGDDTFIVDSASDVTGEGQPTGGTDTVLSSVTRSLGANIENLTLTGSANINATGNNLDNILTGNIGNNTLSDGAGNDQLFGGLGNDTLSAGAGTDYLDGGEGADTMFGGLGDDTYVVDNTGDITQEGPSAGGIDTILSSVTRSLGANLENLTLTGTNAINGVGNTLANTIAGNSAANTLTGGGGADAFVFNTALGAGNIDTISDFVVVDDTIHLSNAIFGLGAGALSASAFVIGAAAADASDRIIYDSATGALYFDADGDGAGAAIHFATLGTGLALTSDDFWGFG